MLFCQRMQLPVLLAPRYFNKHMKVRRWLFVFFLIFVPVMTIQAYEIPGLEKTAGVAGINRYPTNPEEAVTRIIQWVLSFVGVIFLILMIVGGFKWMTSGGNQETINNARRTVASAAIGLIIVLSAYAITVYLGSIFANTTVVPST